MRVIQTPQSAEIQVRALIFWGVLLAAISLSISAGVVLAPRATIAIVGIICLTIASVPLTSRYRPTLHWWHFVVLLFLISGLVWRSRGTSEALSNPLDDAAGFRILAVVGAVGIAYLRLLGRRLRLEDLWGGFFLPLTIFSVVNILSTAWSVNPQWTLYKSLEYFLLAMSFSVIVLTMTANEYRRVLDWSWLLLGLVLASSLVWLLLMPSVALVDVDGLIGWSFEGWLPKVSRNELAEIAAILSIISYVRATRKNSKAFHITLLVAALVILVLLQTRSALVAFAGAFLLVTIVMRRWKALAVIGVLIGAALVVIGSQLLVEYLARGQSVGAMRILTGRTRFWELAFERLEERPWTGFGAFAGGRFEVAVNFYDGLSSTHGTIPELLVNTSLWGLIPVVALVGLLWIYFLRITMNKSWAARHGDDWPYAVECMGILAILSIRSFFDVEFIWHPALAFLVLVGYAEALRRRQNANQQTGYRTDPVLRRNDATARRLMT